MGIAIEWNCGAIDSWMNEWMEKAVAASETQLEQRIRLKLKKEKCKNAKMQKCNALESEKTMNTLSPIINWLSIIIYHLFSIIY